MRFTLAHSLTAAQLRDRLKARAPEIAQMVPGGLAQVATTWPSDTRMDLTLSTFGKQIDGYVEIAEHEATFVVNLPASLAMLEPMISSALEEKGRKLLK